MQRVPVAIKMCLRNDVFGKPLGNKVLVNVVNINSVPKKLISHENNSPSFFFWCF